MLAIWKYIAEDNEQAADHFLESLTDQFRLLGDNALAGRLRDELREGYRSFPVGKYLVLYRLKKGKVEIMNVVHGMRDLNALFPPK